MRIEPEAVHVARHLAIHFALELLRSIVAALRHGTFIKLSPSYGTSSASLRLSVG